MDSQLIDTTLGTYRGIVKDGIRIFRGIPYASPPQGRLRFHQAEPVPAFCGVRDCLSFAPTPLQPRRQWLPMSEDCLYLNIWTLEKVKNPLPVIVVLHGGSLIRGSGADAQFDGTKLALAGPALVVTLNFRLGVWGFMDFSFLGDKFMTNVGMRDILSALAWLKEHIEAFGGDPQNITLLGQSSGGTLALALAAMPFACSYFTRVISMSGNPLLVQPKEHYMELARKFLDLAEISSPQQLIAADASHLLKVQRKFKASMGKGAGTFMLVQDHDLISQLPIPAARAGMPHKMPFLLGTTREELSFSLNPILARLLEVNQLVDTGAEREDDALRSKIRQAYSRYGRRHQAVLRSEIVFRMPNIWLAEALSAGNPVWLYRFDYASSLQRILGLDAFHSSDLPYVFGSHSYLQRFLFGAISPKNVTRTIGNDIQRDFLNFASQGELPWPQVSKNDHPAKCYAFPSTIQPASEQDVVALFKQTQYYRRSIEPEKLYAF